MALHPGLWLGLRLRGAIGSSPLAQGQVENQVGVVRRRFFVPRPKSKSHAELNAWREDRCVAWARSHPHPELRDRTIWEIHFGHHAGEEILVDRNRLALFKPGFVGPRCEVAENHHLQRQFNLCLPIAGSGDKLGVDSLLESDRHAL